MSQLFDALRRSGRSSATRSGSARPSNGDAVLATLGYSPARRRRSGSGLGKLLAFVALVALAWYGWTKYWEPRADDIPRPNIRQPSATARPTPVPGTQTPANTAAGPGSPGASGTGITTPAVTAALPTGTPSLSTVKGPLRTVTPLPTATLPQNLSSSPAPEPPNPRAAELPSPRAPELPSPRAPEFPGIRVPEPTRPTGTVKPAVDHWAQALYHQKDGDFENALKHYTALLEQQPLNAQVRNNLGMLYQEQGLGDEAVREFRRAINIDPGYSRAHNNLGVALLAQRNTDGAAAAFRAALELDRRNVDALVNLAIADERLGRRERAKEGLLRALAIDPRNALAHYNLGVLYDETGEAAMAIQHYRSFLEHASVEYARRAADVRVRLNALSRAR